MSKKLVRIICIVLAVVLIISVVIAAIASMTAQAVNVEQAATFVTSSVQSVLV